MRNGLEHMTDVKSGPELVEKAFVYMTNISRECRKILTAKFGQTYRGMPFESIEPAMRKEIESWFGELTRTSPSSTRRPTLGNRGRS